MIDSIDKSAMSTVAREKKTRKIHEEYRRLRARCRQDAAYTHWKKMTDELATCKCTLNKTMDDPTRFKSLDVFQMWYNLEEYKRAVGLQRAKPYIVSRLSCSNVPPRRRDRSQKMYEVYGVKMCYHAMLSVFSIPLTTAQQAMCVCVCVYSFVVSAM